MSVILRAGIMNSIGNLLQSAAAENHVTLQPEQPYNSGDSIVVWSSTWPVMLQIRFDDHLASAVIWLTADRMDYPVPVGTEHAAYPPSSFTGKPGRIDILAIPQTIAEESRNLSENSLDRRGYTMYFPHCTASVETRGEAVFAARNTIDGICENRSHGAWPYQSWGDDENPLAEIMIEFGRSVLVKRIEIQLRADFPHDNYWQRGTLLFSDGTKEEVRFIKTEEKQVFAFSERKISWVKLTDLHKDETESSPFPALTQWTVWGKEMLK